MAENGSVTADGYTGKVEFDGSTIRIERPGLRGKIGYGNAPSAINAHAVTRVAFTDATMMKNGTITFFTPGHESALEAFDPNTVIFTKKQAPAFAALRDTIQAIVRARGADAKEALDVQDQVARAEQAEAARLTSVVRYEEHVITGGKYASQAGPKPVVGAVFDTGADMSRPTLTRVGAGAIIAGPAGAIVGGLFKKNSSKCYVTVEFADGEAVVIEGPIKDEAKLRQFAADVNRVAA